MDVEFDGTTRIKAKLGALAVTIYMEKARKFASTADQVQYEHLNVDIESGIPNDAKGIFAELAGVQTVSEATAALLRPPRATSFVGAPPRPLEGAAGPCPAGCVAEEAHVLDSAAGHCPSGQDMTRDECYSFKLSHSDYVDPNGAGVSGDLVPMTFDSTPDGSLAHLPKGCQWFVDPGPDPTKPYQILGNAPCECHLCGSEDAYTAVGVCAVETATCSASAGAAADGCYTDLESGCDSGTTCDCIAKTCPKTMNFNRFVYSVSAVDKGNNGLDFQCTADWCKRSSSHMVCKGPKLTTTPCECKPCGSADEGSYADGECSVASDTCSASAGAAADGCYTDCESTCDCRTKTCTHP